MVYAKSIVDSDVARHDESPHNGRLQLGKTYPCPQLDGESICLPTEGIERIDSDCQESLAEGGSIRALVYRGSPLQTCRLSKHVFPCVWIELVFDEREILKAHMSQPIEIGDQVIGILAPLVGVIGQVLSMQNSVIPSSTTMKIHVTVSPGVSYLNQDIYVFQTYFKRLAP